MSDEQRPLRRHGPGNLLLKDSQRSGTGLINYVKRTRRGGEEDLYFTGLELSFKKIIHVNLGLVKHVVLTEFLVKILRERAVICRECFLFYYNFRIGQKIFFIFAYIR